MHFLELAGVYCAWSGNRHDKIPFEVLVHNEIQKDKANNQRVSLRESRVEVVALVVSVRFEARQGETEKGKKIRGKRKEKKSSVTIVKASCSHPSRVPRYR